MYRLLAAVAVLGLSFPLVALSGAGAASKARNGLISFWSDRDFGGRAQVFLMNADGTGQRRITSLFSAKRGDWSPDGSRLVIDGRDHDTLDDFDVFTVNADGTDLRKITSGPQRDTQATWSPNGQLISFVRASAGGGRPSLWIVGVDGGNAHRVTYGGPAVWSPDGRKLAVGGFGLRVMDPTGRHARTIVRGESEPAAWSADGRRILFSSWRDGNPEVYLVNANGRHLRRLTHNYREDLAADFSPDGRLILFSSDRRGLRQVYVMNRDGSGVRNLSRSQSNDWSTSWQPLH